MDTAESLKEKLQDNAGGKVVMIDEFKCLDAAMIIHALDMTTVTCESFNREALEIEFIGKAANAGNAEDASKGMNALEAVMLTWQGINAFRLLLKSDTRVFGIITEGGVSPNIVPERAVTKIQIRVEDGNYFQEVVEKVIYRYLDCGILHNGFARVKCEESGHEYLLAFSCKPRHFCPACHQKRVVKFGEWACREVVKAIPHHHVVLNVTISISNSK